MVPTWKSYFADSSQRMALLFLFTTGGRPECRLGPAGSTKTSQLARTDKPTCKFWWTWVVKAGPGRACAASQLQGLRVSVRVSLAIQPRPPASAAHVACSAKGFLVFWLAANMPMLLTWKPKVSLFHIIVERESPDTHLKTNNHSKHWFVEENAGCLVHCCYKITTIRTARLQKVLVVSTLIKTAYYVQSFIYIWYTWITVNLFRNNFY